MFIVDEESCNRCNRVGSEGNLNKATSKRTNTNIDALKNKQSTTVEFASVFGRSEMLMEKGVVVMILRALGSDKKILLQTLPQKFEGIIRPNTSETVIQLSKVNYMSIVHVLPP
jgi:hypothetical protein